MIKDLKTWWASSSEAMLEYLTVDPSKGLSNDQIIKNQKRFGTNKIFIVKPRTQWDIILETFKEPMMLLLLATAVLAFLFGKIGTAVAMVLEVIIYALLELYNKYRSDQLMTHLKNLAIPTVKVLREGKLTEISVEDIVVGDILILFEGTVIGADALLVTSSGLILEEASLTGESIPVEKQAGITLYPDTVIAERRNAVFSGTTVMSGEGIALVTAVGTESEIGKIAHQVQIYKEEQTLIQLAMNQLAKILAFTAIAVSIVIPLLGFFWGFELEEMILTWLTLTFLMIPCQPPIIITVCLSLAAFLLAKKHVVSKRLFGIEGIGQVSMVVSDKTGTITESKMILESFCTKDGITKDISLELKQELRQALPDFCTHIMDRAILQTLSDVQKVTTPVKIFGFTNDRYFRDIVYQQGNEFVHMITGSPEFIVASSNSSSQAQEVITHFITQKAQEGCKLVAYAKKITKTSDLVTEHDFDLLAIAAVKDPVRQGVPSALEVLSNAGIPTLIVTGDHKLTAQAIAREVGVLGAVITGTEFDQISNQQIFEKTRTSTIFARMNPMQKLRLVNILKKNNEVVAVIGDGVNDAPALRAANVGIAMGTIGTDLAKDVADLILADDNYVHLPNAISISRTALDNFKKGLTFYLAAKVILLCIFVVPLLFGIPFPFLPIHIILIELLLDVSSSTMFVSQEAEPDVMLRPSEKISDFLGKKLFLDTVKYGIPLALAILSLYSYYFFMYNVTTAQTIALVGWLIGQIFLAMNLTQRKKTILQQGLRDYIVLFWLFCMGIIAWAITSIELFQHYFKTISLSAVEWMVIIAVTMIATCWIDLMKYCTRNR